jgi:cellulase/cellobiase CelA1
MQNQIITKIFNAVDSDDIHALASNAETNLTKEGVDEIKKKLKQMIEEQQLNTFQTRSVKQFLYFLQ